MKEQNYQADQTRQKEQNTNNPVYQPKKKRKWLKIATWIISIIIIAILFFDLPEVLSIIWGKDAPDPDDSDLILSAVNIPPNDNSYFDLIKLSSISDDKTKEALVKIDMPNDVNDLNFLESYNWDINSIEELLNKNEQALQIFSDAANKTQFQFEPTANPENIKSSMPVFVFSSYRQLAMINAIKAIYLMRQGKEESAFDEAIKIIKIGSDIEKSKNICLVGYIIGIGVEKIGLETIQTLISNTSLPSETLSFFQEQIRKFQPINNSDPFRVEYLVFRDEIKHVKHARDSSLDEDAKNLSKSDFYFKPNKTIEYAIDHYRKIIDIFENPCNDTSTIIEDLPEVSPEKIYFTENAVGKLLAKLPLSSNLKSIRDKKCNIGVLVDFADILFAIKKYRLENNDYMQNLQILSPNYINQLPSDKFSGQSFIVNTNDMTIHSVGANRNDDNGQGDDILASYKFFIVETKTADIIEDVQLNANIDADKDGLTDKNEVIYGTNPNNSDTDGDGYFDGDEVANGYDPLK